MSNETPITLSFCIPTYNFGRFIGATLQSIIEQSTAEVEIVIVDGGSTDDTVEVVARAAARFPRIKLIRREENCGVDRDILESVEQARGRFCWLFSSDDLIAPGAVRRVLDAIEAGDFDVLLTGLTICDLDVRPLWPHGVLDEDRPRSFDWSVPAERAAYFALAQTSTAFFSFIGDIIVRRDRWRAAPSIEAYVGSCWSIAAKIYAMSIAGLVVRFDPAQLLLKRGDNDSFAARGLLWRTALAVRGFRHIAWDFFGRGSMEATHVSRVLKNEYTLPVLLQAKLRLAQGGDAGQQRALAELVALHYEDGALADRLRHLGWRATPVWALPVLERALQVARSALRRLRR